MSDKKKSKAASETNPANTTAGDSAGSPGPRDTQGLATAASVGTGGADAAAADGTGPAESGAAESARPVVAGFWQCKCPATGKSEIVQHDNQSEAAAIFSRFVENVYGAQVDAAQLSVEPPKRRPRVGDDVLVMSGDTVNGGGQKAEPVILRRSFQG